MPLGRGCPRTAGQPVDASGHWFDPARAGNGYGVQFWPGYELFAAFTYDGQGSPLHLVAELPRFGGDSASLPLQRLLGACPTCPYAEPRREPAGTLSRSLENGRLHQARLDAEFTESWPFAPVPWRQSSADTLQPLGGPQGLQGCAP